MRSRLFGIWPIVGLLTSVAGVLLFHLWAAQNERRSVAESFPSDNFSTIEDGLLVGGILSAPPSGSRAVLNVCETADPYQAEVHRWSPIPDAGPAPELDWLRAQVDFVAEQRRAGRPIYIHCRAGVSRSVMVVAAFLMERDGLSRDQALAVIREKRPRAGPLRVYQDYLHEWERSLR